METHNNKHAHTQAGISLADRPTDPDARHDGSALFGLVAAAESKSDRARTQELLRTFLRSLPGHNWAAAARMSTNPINAQPSIATDTGGCCA